MRTQATRVITRLTFCPSLLLIACASSSELAAPEDAEPELYADESLDGDPGRSAPTTEQSEADMEESIASPKEHREERRIAQGRRDKGGGKAKKASHGAPAGTMAVAPSPEPMKDGLVGIAVDREHNTEAYQHIAENDFLAVADKPLSTFSIDVDTASYSNMRRFLTDGSLPPPDAVRVEELINYFNYDYSEPVGNAPFGVATEVSDCPWNPDARLVQIGIQGKNLQEGKTPARNLVFLLDVSGSMDEPDKLPLVKSALRLLTSQLNAKDHVSIVVYAGASGVVLDPTSDKQKILESLERLSAGGSTNGGEGIELAYALAEKNFSKGAINRVILATDGDFNVGTTSHGELTRLIEQKRKSGVFLSVLGFGTGNVKDSTMETLADKGNGNYAYIDSIEEARKVLVEEAGSTLVTIAKDVKIQVEFNPALVESYRLVGYENRALADKDFNDDTKDAGEIGAGHTVTALYEVMPVGAGKSQPKVDPLRFQNKTELTPAASSTEMMHLKLRYKAPQGAKSSLLTFPIEDDGRPLAHASDDFRFAAAVAEFGLILRGSKYVGQGDLGQVRRLAEGAIGRDEGGWRKQFVSLVDLASALRGEDKGGLKLAK